ncbi:MAG TPA: metal ABC transporter substrate-binding protein [Methanocorpusculum sp.]|nr:metal ABC transporter substrate-binding protein [Methanocorpusculum sp.]
MFKSRKLVIIGIVVLLALICIGGITLFNSEEPLTTNNSTILVTVPPMIDIVSNLLGNDYNVISIIPSGKSPHTYEPTPSDILKFKNANLWIRLGDGFLPIEDRIVNSTSIKNISIGKDIKALVEEGSDDPHEIDPHIWMSAKNGIKMTELIRDCLSDIYPDNRDVIFNNADVYLHKLKDVDIKIQKSVKQMNPPIFIATHGSFGYLSSDYNLKQLVVEHDGKEPTAQELKNIIDKARKFKIHIVITEKLSSRNIADTISKELNVTPITIDPLSTDYIGTLNSIADALK